MTIDLDAIEARAKRAVENATPKYLLDSDRDARVIKEKAAIAADVLALVARCRELEESDEGLHRARATINAQSEDICNDIIHLQERAERAEARVKELSAERDDVARRLIVLETGDYTALTERLAKAEEVCESIDRYMTNPDWPHPREGMDVMADLAAWRKVKIEP